VKVNYKILSLKAIGLISSSVYADNHHWCLDFIMRKMSGGGGGGSGQINIGKSKAKLLMKKQM
jgi:ATP-dependent Zn protease